MTEAEIGVISFEGGGRGHEPRNAGSLKQLGKARGQILL